MHGTMNVKHMYSRSDSAGSMPEEIQNYRCSILKWKIKEPLPVFMPTLGRIENINKMYEITDIRRMRVEITPYRETKPLPRCKNCQS